MNSLFPDGLSRNQPFLCLVTRPAKSIDFRIVGCLIPAARSRRNGGRSILEGDVLGTEGPCSPRHTFSWRRRAGSPKSCRGSRKTALIHYLAPRGLEQYSGGGWGTRDVTQGPVEMLLALGRFEALRDLLMRVFKQQNIDGDWPQWFMFFDRERNIRAEDSHGDIVFWPVLALARYLSASEDRSILDEDAPFYAEREEDAERATIRQHVERALAIIGRRRNARNPSRGIWPRRLERHAATRRRKHARKVMQRLDSDAPLPELSSR